MSSLSFLRGFEREADRVAVGLMSQAGYDPAEFVSFLEKLPAEQARLEAVRAAIELLPARRYESATGEFEAMVSRLRR